MSLNGEHFRFTDLPNTGPLTLSTAWPLLQQRKAFAVSFPPSPTPVFKILSLLLKSTTDSLEYNQWSHVMCHSEDWTFISWSRFPKYIPCYVTLPPHSAIWGVSLHESPNSTSTYNGLRTEGSIKGVSLPLRNLKDKYDHFQLSSFHCLKMKGTGLQSCLAGM